jgi:hypothetical protein
MYYLFEDPEETEIEYPDGKRLGHRRALHPEPVFGNWNLIAENVDMFTHPCAEFDPEVGQYVIPLQAIFNDKWQKVKEIRTTKEEGSAPTTLGGPVNIDEKSKGKISNALNMSKLCEEMELPFSIEFKFADNVVRTLDSQKVKQLALEAAMYVNNVFAHSFALEQQLKEALDTDNRETLEALDVEAGWPE